MILLTFFDDFIDVFFMILLTLFDDFIDFFYDFLDLGGLFWRIFPAFFRPFSGLFPAFAGDRRARVTAKVCLVPDDRIRGSGKTRNRHMLSVLYTTWRSGFVFPAACADN